MTTAINEIMKRSLNPVILIHERGDNSLAKVIINRLGIDLPIVDEDPITTKGIIGCCHSIISSRYHALVSALSQGVPFIGTAWTHKYARLFEEFNCSECLLEGLDSREEIINKINLLTNLETRTKLIARIKERAKAAKQEVHRMWEILESLLEY